MSDPETIESVRLRMEKEIINKVREIVKDIENQQLQVIASHRK
jgi:Icc-related predicted phosphoesterase